MYQAESVAVTVSATLADCDAFPMGSFCGGIIEVPTGSSVTSLTFYHGMTEGGDFWPLYDEDGVSVSITVAAESAYTQPDALNECVFVKAIANATGSINWAGKAL